MLELETIKDEVSYFQYQANKDNEVIEEEY